MYIVWRVTLTLNFQDAFRCQCTIDSSYLYYMTCDHYYEYCLFFFPSCHQGISSHDIIDCRQSTNSCLPRQCISSSWYIFQPLNCSVFVYSFIYWSTLFIHFQIVISFSRIVSYYSNISVWNWFNTINIHSALWILMAWCFSTRASVATVLSMHPCLSRCLWVNGGRMTYNTHAYFCFPKIIQCIKNSHLNSKNIYCCLFLFVIVTFWCWKV